MIETNKEKLNMKWVGDMKKALCWVIPLRKYKDNFESLTAFM